MSSDETPNTSAPRERREAVREKAQQVRARQSRMGLIRAAAIAVGALAVIVAGAVVVTMTVSSEAAKPLLTPTNVTNDGFQVVGVEGVGLVTDNPAATGSPEPTETPEPAETTDAAADQSKVDIRVYVDYLSTGSRDFQLSNVQQLSNWYAEDAATVTYYPVAMLTSKSNGTKYSQRAAGAAACVGTHAPESFFAFNNALLAQQPDIDSDGFNDSELAALAIASGAKDPKKIRECIEEQDFTGWAKDATERALQGIPDTDSLELTSAPTVLVNGMPYVGALTDPKEFSQFVLTIASDTYYEETATPTPTPTP
jgi:protein-disulfide isomerase